MAARKEVKIEDLQLRLVKLENEVEWWRDRFETEALWRQVIEDWIRKQFDFDVLAKVHSLEQILRPMNKRLKRTFYVIDPVEDGDDINIDIDMDIQNNERDIEKETKGNTVTTTSSDDAIATGMGKTGNNGVPNKSLFSCDTGNDAGVKTHFITSKSAPKKLEVSTKKDKESCTRKGDAKNDSGPTFASIPDSGSGVKNSNLIAAAAKAQMSIPAQNLSVHSVYDDGDDTPTRIMQSNEYSTIQIQNKNLVPSSASKEKKGKVKVPPGTICNVVPPPSHSHIKQYAKEKPKPNPVQQLSHFSGSNNVDVNINFVSSQNSNRKLQRRRCKDPLQIFENIEDEMNLASTPQPNPPEVLPDHHCDHEPGKSRKSFEDKDLANNVNDSGYKVPEVEFRLSESRPIKIEKVCGEPELLNINENSTNIIASKSKTVISNENENDADISERQRLPLSQPIQLENRSYKNLLEKVEKTSKQKQRIKIKINQNTKNKNALGSKSKRTIVVAQKRKKIMPSKSVSSTTPTRVLRSRKITVAPEKTEESNVKDRKLKLNAKKKRPSPPALPKACTKIKSKKVDVDRHPHRKILERPHSHPQVLSVGSMEIIEMKNILRNSKTDEQAEEEVNVSGYKSAFVATCSAAAAAASKEVTVKINLSSLNMMTVINQLKEKPSFPGPEQQHLQFTPGPGPSPEANAISLTEPVPTPTAANEKPLICRRRKQVLIPKRPMYSDCD